MSCDASVTFDPTVSGGTLIMSAASAAALVRRVLGEGERAILEGELREEVREGAECEFVEA